MLRPTLEAIKSRGQSLVTNRILIKQRNVSGNRNGCIDTDLALTTYKTIRKSITDWRFE